MDELEKQIINSTKEFAAFNNIHFDELTQSMVLNAIRETKQKLNIHGVSGKQLTYCQCEVPTGRTVTADFENQICESCGRLVACATAKGRKRKD